MKIRMLVCAFCSQLCGHREPARGLVWRSLPIFPKGNCHPERSRGIYTLSLGDRFFDSLRSLRMTAPKILPLRGRASTVGRSHDSADHAGQVTVSNQCHMAAYKTIQSGATNNGVGGVMTPPYMGGSIFRRRRCHSFPLGGSWQRARNEPLTDEGKPRENL